MSETKVPNELKVLPEADQIAVGNVANKEDEALPTVVLTEAVPAVTAAPREEEAVPTIELVLALTEVVPAVIAAAIDEDAELVLPLTTAAIDEEAVVTSDWRARLPESRVASDKRRVA